jgi:hypothetical protein
MYVLIVITYSIVLLEQPAELQVISDDSQSYRTSVYGQPTVYYIIKL